MKQAGQKSVKEDLPEQRKAPKRAVECQLKVQTHIWEQEARGSSPRTPTSPPQAEKRLRRAFLRYCISRYAAMAARS